MMKQRVTTKEEILEHALNIAIEEGVDQVSIRKLAASLNIAVGSMYNYYKDKESLMTAVSEHFWNNILKDQEQLFRPGMGFTMFLEQYYGFLYGRLYRHDISWLSAMDETTKDQALGLFMRVLEADERVIGSIWNMELNQKAFCEYVLNNIMALIRTGESNCRFFIFLLDHLLYDA